MSPHKAAVRRKREENKNKLKELGIYNYTVCVCRCICLYNHDYTNHASIQGQVAKKQFPIDQSSTSRRLNNPSPVCIVQDVRIL